MLNKVMLIGRLGADPELSYVKESGTPFTRFNVATNDYYIDRDGKRVEKTEWTRIVVFGKAAENCSNYLGKGSMVYIEGSLQTRKWQDQQGQERSSTEVRAQRVQFLDRKGDTRPTDDMDGYGRQQYNQQPQYGQQTQYGQQSQYNQGQPYQQQRYQNNGGQYNQAPQRGRSSGQGAGPGAKPVPQDEDMGSPFPSDASPRPSENITDEVPF